MDKKKKSIVAILMLICMYLNIEDMVSLMLADFAVMLPNAGAVEIQKIYSLIFFVEIFANIGAGWLAGKLSKRKIVIIFQLGTVAGGMFAYFCGTTLLRLYFSSVVIGISAAVISTVSKSMMKDYFTSEGIPKVVVLQEIATNAGTLLLSLAGGYLCSKFMRGAYLIYLVGVPSLVMAIFLLPEGKAEKREKGKNVKIFTPSLIHDVVLTCLFLMIFIGFQTELSFAVAEKNLGGASFAGVLMALSTAVQVVTTAFNNAVLKLTGKNWAVFSMVIMIFAFICLIFADSIFLFGAGAMLSGVSLGIFSPTMYAHVTINSDSSVNTVSCGMMQTGGCLGIYLYPYLVTAPALLISSKTWARFSVSVVYLVIFAVCESLYQRKNQLYVKS